MTDYVKIINFTAKDALLTGDPNKIARGTDMDSELSLIATAIASKFDTGSTINVSQLTGTLADARLAASNVTQFQTTTGNVGYLGIPQNTQTAGPYTCVLTDASKHIYTNGSVTGTITVPANGSVAYPIGTVLVIVNGAGGTSLLIAVTTDTMYLAGVGTTGTRTLGPLGQATLLKISATTWLVSGAGLT